MSIPPFMRRIQQSWTFHVVMAAIFVIGGTAFTCFGVANDFTVACAKGGLIAGGVYLFASFQHSPGSASFKSDGTPNEVVEKVIAAQSIGVPVAAVVPKEAAREVAEVMTKQ